MRSEDETIEYFRQWVPILQTDDEPILHSKSDTLTHSFIVGHQDLIQKAVDGMTKFLRMFHAAGIAAPQVGLPFAMALVPADDERTKMICVINPVITRKSVKRSFNEEGCLSYPDCRVPVWRNQEIEVEFYDQTGEVRTGRVTGFAARVWQHEIDHLNGVTMTDHGAPIKSKRR